MQAVDSNAKALRAGGQAPRSTLLDSVEKDAVALRQYEDQKRRAMYGIPVSDDEYSLISSAISLSDDPDTERWNWASAKMYSQRLGIPMENARANLESISRAWLQSPNVTNGKGHFESIADSFRVGDLTMDAAALAKRWKDTGGQDKDLERKIDALYGEMAKMQDRFPRGIIATALKFGAESAPFIAQVMGKGLLAGGAAAAAVGLGTAAMGGTAATFGLAAPVGAAAMASALTLAASKTGSFMASMQIMEALDYYDMRKNGVSHEIASPLAMVSGGIQATLESFLGNVPGLLGKLGGEAITGISGNVAKTLLISGRAGALGTAIMGYAGEIVEEGAEEALQSIASDLIKNVAAGLEGKGLSQAEAGEIATNAWENFKGGALASLGYGLPSAFIGYKGAARQSKALKEYAASTDRETFVENASKWKDVEDVPEKQRKAALERIWEKAQKKAKETRESAPEGEVKPFKRTEAGTLYTEEKTIESSEDGKVEAILKVGDAETKERLGYLKYEITEDGIVLDNARFKKGYEGVRDEAIQELAAKYPGLPITASDGAPDGTRAAVDRLTAANPHGTGANWFSEGGNPEIEKARAKLRLVIADKMPNVTPVQREAAILMHEFRANAMGIGFDEYLKNEFSPEIIGEKTGRVSAAQGQRAGILFTKGDQELRIGEFVRDAKALIMTTEKSDFVSFVHESGHMFRKQLIGTDLGMKLEEAYNIVGGQWTREHEEAFVDDLVKYLSYGEAKDERLKGVFQRIAEWITRLWDKVLKQADIDPRIRAVMDELFKSDVSPLQEAASTSVIAEEQEGPRDAIAVQQESKEEVLFQKADPIDSEAFKNWFGDSKVVDSEGKPLVMYHGTTSEIEAFDPLKAGQSNTVAGVGFWFTPQREFAERFIQGLWYGDRKPNILSVYLSIKNPKVFEVVEPNESLINELEAQIKGIVDEAKTLTNQYGWNALVFEKITKEEYESKKVEIEKLHQKKKTIEGQIAKHQYGDPYQQFKTDIYEHAGQTAREANIGGLGMVLQNPEEALQNYREKLRSEGYDGILIKGTTYDANIAGGPNDQYVALDPEQIKSIGNRGTWDSNDPRILFQYIGERAELDDIERQNLSVAKEMAQSEKDSETIRLATGWFKGKYDGKWRLETDSRLAIKKPWGDTWDELENLIVFPTLFKKYPQLRKLLTRFEKTESEPTTRGSYTRAVPSDLTYKGREAELRISATSREEAKKTIIHELQHAIQDIEGFSRGSDPKQFRDEYKRLNELVDELNAAMKEADKKSDTKKYNALMNERQLIIPRIQELQGKTGIVGLDMYWNTAGEIEARDAASRMGLSPEQCEAIAPYSSENIATEDAVVLFQLDEETVGRIEEMDPIRVTTPRLPTATSDVRRWMVERFRTFSNVVNRDTGREVELVISAAKKVSQHLAKRDTAAIVSDLPEIVEKAIFLDAEKNRKPDVKRIHEARHYAAWIELDGEPRFVTLTTQVYQGREQLDQLKNWQVEKKEAAADRLIESGAAASSVGHEPHRNRIVELIRSVKPDFLFEEEFDDTTLFQLDDESINAEAAKYDTWQAWKADEEATSEWITEQARPGDLEGKDLDDWYRTRWEAVRAKAEEEAAGKRVEARKEARRGEFAASMAKAGGVENLLASIWDAEVQAFDVGQAMDEEEQAEIEKSEEWKVELSRRLADHPLVLLSAQSVGQGKKLSPSTRKAILTYIRHNEIEFAALYAELTGDLDLAQYAEAGREKLQSIPDPKLERYADMSIAERTALLNNISDKEVRDRIKAGEYDDDYLSDYVRRLEESKKLLTKESEDAKAEIEKLGGKLEAESDFALKMYDRSKTAAKALESKGKELAKVKAAKERVEAAKSAYVEALGSARDESKLSAKIAKKEYLAALNEARKEAAFQARFVAAEIRATAKLRAQRDANRRAIMKKPAKNIIWEKRQEILTIQEYLRSKKWEYIEEQDDTGKKRRRRAYDTVVGEDGKKHKVPRYTTVQAENMKAALSMLLRESPSLIKILTNETVDRINDKPFSAWTLAELQDLRSIIDRIAKEGREAYDLKKMMENREASADRYEIENGIRKNKRYKAPAAHGSEEEKAIRKKMEGFATWELPAMKMRYFAPLLDNGIEGVNTKLLVKDEYEARRQKQREKVRRLRKVQTRMRELKMTQKERQRKITIPGIGPGATDVTMSAARLAHVSLLLRNDKGRAAFIYGNLFSEHERTKMTRDFLQANGDAKYLKLTRAIDQNLTTGEKEIIDMIAEGFGSAEFDRQNKAVIELTNEEMKPEKNYSPLYREGAYFESQKDSIIDSMKAKYGFVVNPESGFTIARINIAPEHQSPVRVMDIVSMFEDAVDTQEHLIAYGAYVKKLHAVYQNQQLSKAVREGIIQTYGKDGMEYVDKYIGAIASADGDSSGHTPGDKALKKLRGYQAVGFLAFRWTSVVKQLITSPLPYMAYAPKETLAAAFEAIGSGHMLKFIEEIEGKSEMLQSRTIDQLFEAIKAMDAEGWEGLIKKIGTTGMKGLEFADRISVAIGWKGVYDKELAAGATEEDAIKKADDITFQTQPSANPADLAPIYRDMNEWKRILLMFTSSLNTVYNNIAHGVPKAIREKEYGQAIGIVASYAIAGTLLGAFAKSLGKDPPPDDPDEWWRQWLFYSMTQFTDSVPLIGQEFTGVMKRMVSGDKRLPFGEDTLPTVSAIIQGFDSLSKGDIEKAAQNFAEGVGLATGMPTLAIEEYAKNLGSLIEGKGDKQ